MVVQKTSLFPASKETVFRKLQQLETLQIIAKPYATFEPIGETVSVWAVGSLRMRLSGLYREAEVTAVEGIGCFRCRK